MSVLCFEFCVGYFQTRSIELSGLLTSAPCYKQDLFLHYVSPVKHILKILLLQVLTPPLILTIKLLSFIFKILHFSFSSPMLGVRKVNIAHTGRFGAPGNFIISAKRKATYFVFCLKHVFQTCTVQ